MEDSLLLEKSKQAQAAAEKILTESKLVERLAPLGRVEIIGSVRLGVVYRPDIDLLVITDSVSRAGAVEAVKLLLGDGYFQTVELIDYQQFPEYDTPLGFYFGLRVPFEGVSWKLDVWYLRTEEAYTQLIMTALPRFEAALAQSSHKAATVLEIKEAFFDGVKYRDGVKGTDIYRAVLDDGVDSVEGFADWFKR